MNVTLTGYNETMTDVCNETFTRAKGKGAYGGWLAVHEGHYEYTNLQMPGA